MCNQAYKHSVLACEHEQIVPTHSQTCTTALLKATENCGVVTSHYVVVFVDKLCVNCENLKLIK